MTTTQLQEQVNETIIKSLEQGGVPWRSDHGFPRNILSRRRFGGIEAILLMLAGQRQRFTSCWWGTRQEWDTLGGKVKDGQGTEIVVGNGQCFKTATVWNLNQIDGDFPVSRRISPRVDYALVERVIAGTKADIRFTDEKIAEYHFPGTDPNGDGDYVRICRREHFERGPGGWPSFYHTLSHELSHFSEVRLDWHGPQDVQELRAEMASDFFTTEFLIPNYPYQCRRNLHHYLAVWTNEMRREPSMIFKVARDAAQAVDFILGFTFKVEPRHRAD